MYVAFNRHAGVFPPLVLRTRTIRRQHKPPRSHAQQAEQIMPAIKNITINMNRANNKNNSISVINNNILFCTVVSSNYSCGIVLFFNSSKNFVLKISNWKIVSILIYIINGLIIVVLCLEEGR